MANMSIDQILDELSKDDSEEKVVLSEDMNRLLRDESKEEVRDLSFLEILGIESRETSVSKVLAFLLDPANDSGNPMFLRLLFEKCGVSNIYDFSGTKVDTEVCTSENKYIDILAVSEDRFMLLIENKIRSSEHGDQTVAYYDYCEKKYESCDCRVYIYLKPQKNGFDPPKANEKRGKNTYDELFYDDIIDILKEVVSSDGHRHNYKVIAEQFLSYCKSYLGKESVMGNRDKACIAYMNNKREFDELERRLQAYKGSYEEWVSKIKEDLKKRIEDYCKNEAKQYKHDFCGGKDYKWVHVYDRSKEHFDNEYHFYAEIAIYNSDDESNPLNVEIRSVVHKYGDKGSEKITSGNYNVPDEFKGERKEEIDIKAVSRNCAYIIYDRRLVDISDFIADDKEGDGDTEEIGGRIFDLFKEYREGRANEIFKAFKEGYDSVK